MPPRQTIQRMSILIAQVEADIQVWSEQYEKKKKKKKKGGFKLKVEKKFKTRLLVLSRGKKIVKYYIRQLQKSKMCHAMNG